MPCPSPGDLPNLGIEPVFLMSLALADRFFTTSTTWEAQIIPLHSCILSIIEYIIKVSINLGEISTISDYKISQSTSTD